MYKLVKICNFEKKTQYKYSPFLRIRDLQLAAKSKMIEHVGEHVSIWNIST